ncbi:MAG: hypothetical protein OEM49_15020 [Myxococcales bacterium]|nr:hypothetical protein [Myxococcales bacterium]MDH5567739.1 hypothetical protein [Myxococcales bacterium]
MANSCSRALLACAAALWLASAAAAQTREFTGKVEEVGARVLVVSSRMGDRLRFERAENVEVSDQSGGEKPRMTWGDLRAGDWVSVRWNLSDTPRRALRVIVLPPRKEPGGAS